MENSEDPQAVQGKGEAAPEAPYPRETYAWYVVGILLVVYIFSFIDRQILALLVIPIEADLGISDSQMSYLMGFMFALFYVSFGIPMGRLADSKSRRTIIALGLIVWSFMSAGCGVAKTYLHLALMRFGVGIGEATLSPSAYSLITDYFKPNRTALALSVYGAGIYIGSGIAFLVGGFVFEYATTHEASVWPVVGTIRPWQLVFFIIGLPGILFAGMLYTIKEPLRRGIKSGGGQGAQSVPLGEVFLYIRANWKTFLCHNVGFALLSFVGYGSAAWIPTFFVRTYDWTAGDTGKLYGTAVMIFGTAGIVFGGWAADRLKERGYKDAKMRTGLAASLLHLPFALAFPLMPEGWMAFTAMCPAIFLLAMPFGVAPAAIQEMMPNRMRGQASAIYLFIVNLIGLGIGPSAVAWMTDLVFKDPLMIRYSLLICSVSAGLLSVMLLWLGLKPFRNSIDHLKDWLESN